MVSVGNLFDRGPYGEIVLELFERLAEDAAKKGGHVVNLMGNHELGLLKGSETFANDYATNEITRMKIQGTLKNKNLTTDVPAKYLSLFESAGSIGGKIRNRFQVMQKIGDTIFVHAGFSVEFMDQMASDSTSVGDLSKPIGQLKNDLSEDMWEALTDSTQHKADDGEGSIPMFTIDQPHVV